MPPILKVPGAEVAGDKIAGTSLVLFSTMGHKFPIVNFILKAIPNAQHMKYSPRKPIIHTE